MLHQTLLDAGTDGDESEIPELTNVMTVRDACDMVSGKGKEHGHENVHYGSLVRKPETDGYTSCRN